MVFMRKPALTLGEGVKRVKVVSEEIDEIKKKEEALRKKVRDLSRTQRLAHIGNWEWNLQTGKVDWSDEAFRIFGIEPCEVSFELVKSLTHPDDVDFWERSVNEAVFDNKLFSIDYRAVRPDGSVCWIHNEAEVVRDGEGNPLTMFGTAQDITERKQTEEALRKSEERYRHLFESISDAVMIFDAETLRFEDANEAALGLFGFTKEECLTLTPVDISAEPQKMRVRLKETRRGRTEKRQLPLRYFKRKDGTVFPGTVSAGNMMIGGRLKVVSIMRDITDKKLLEEKLVQAQKMEAVGRLAGGVAHDFNNLMTAIMGNAELVLMNMDKADPLREDVLEIQRSGERATSLTRQLLAFSRKQVLQPEVCNLNVILEEMERMLRRLIGDDIELVTSLYPELGYVKIDPSQMEQVIMNLAINARDAMPTGGRLTIETANVYLDNSYAWDDGLVKPGPYVVVAVTDTGEGMEEEVRTKVFDPFFTTKEKGKGTGLGLSTVYGIVTQSDGYIRVYSEPGKGTTFNIYFPEIGQASSRSTKREPKSVGGSGGSETILLVEDEDTLH